MVQQKDLEKFGDFCLTRGFDFRGKNNMIQVGDSSGYSPEPGSEVLKVRTIVDLWEEYQKQKFENSF